MDVLVFIQHHFISLAILTTDVRLPYARTPEARRQRRRMWEAIDVNDNGFVSLAEVTRVNFIQIFYINVANLLDKGGPRCDQCQRVV